MRERSKWRGFTRAAATPDHLSAACVDVWSFPLWSGRSVKYDMIDHRWGTGRRAHSHSSWPPVRARFPNWSKRTGAGGGALPKATPPRVPWYSIRVPKNTMTCSERVWAGHLGGVCPCEWICVDFLSVPPLDVKYDSSLICCIENKLVVHFTIPGVWTRVQ